MDKIHETFNATFAPWQITLPARAGARGEISAAGWFIRYLYAADERGAYLDYYAVHRMTNDRHVRIYADGAVETLEALQPFMVYPTGATPEEKVRIEQRYYEENRRIAAMVLQIGFH